MGGFSGGGRLNAWFENDFFGVFLILCSCVLLLVFFCTGKHDITLLPTMRMCQFNLFRVSLQMFSSVGDEVSRFWGLCLFVASSFWTPSLPFSSTLRSWPPNSVDPGLDPISIAKEYIPHILVFRHSASVPSSRCHQGTRRPSSTARSRSPSAARLSRISPPVVRARFDPIGRTVETLFFNTS